MSEITVFKAKKIITLDPNRPLATHVAVRSGKILAVGGAGCADGWGKSTLNTELENTVLLPGFVEGHAHMMAGSVWKYAYAGFHDRIDPGGVLWRGMTNIDQVIAGLTAHQEKLSDDEPLLGWGFDPIFLSSERLNKHHLDAISTTRPVVVVYSNFHLMCVNSVALELAQFSRHSSAVGVVKGSDGEPTGELREMAAMFPIMRRVGLDFRDLSQKPDAMQSFGQVACRAGVTTVTDLYSSMTDADVSEMQRITGHKNFPVRLVPALNGMETPPDKIAARAIDLKSQSTDMLRLGAVKLMTDGSIQGWTARTKWPHYFGGQPNGIWITAPEQIFDLTKRLHAAGVQMHIHVNGDEASELAIDAIQAAMAENANPGLRHVLQHCQMMGVDQFRRCAELGICVNIFSNHIYYFGDQHAALTLGPDRAERMNACQSALDAGVHFTVHSDAPVTPLAPLFTAWCAVMRQTGSGKTLGEAQKITPMQALHAITLGAAYTLHLDHEVGSIEVGKCADFAVLGDDPLTVEPSAIKDVPVLGTVSGGRVFLV